MVDTLTIKCGKRDDRGRMLVTATLGDLQHVDRFDPLTQFHRKKFREAVVDKFALGDDAHEAVEKLIIDACAFADSDGHKSIFKPVVTMLDTVKPRKVEWLWPDKFPIGKNSLLAGDPGLGKSLLALDMAARVSRGDYFPDCHDQSQEPGDVCILTLEDDPEDTLAPRLLAHGADLSRVAHVSGVTQVDGDGAIHGIDLLSDLDAVREVLRKLSRPRLLIIDTISDYVGATSDLHKNRDVRSILNPLATLAADFRLANLCISHLRKGESRAVTSIMGSVGFVGQCRVAWAITRCPTNAKRRLLTCVKNNLAADTSGLAYTIENHGPDNAAVVCWESQPINMNAEQAMQQLRQPPGRPATERLDAATWLAQRLTSTPTSSAEILCDAEQAGLKAWNVRRAFKQLGGKRTKAGFEGGWNWSLPEDESEDDNQSPHTEICHLPHLREKPEGNINRERYISTLPAKVTKPTGATFDFEEHECNGHEGAF